MWAGVFFRGQVDPKIDDQIWDEVRNIQTKNAELKAKAVELRRLVNSGQVQKFKVIWPLLSRSA